MILCVLPSVLFAIQLRKTSALTNAVLSFFQLIGFKVFGGKVWNARRKRAGKEQQNVGELGWYLGSARVAQRAVLGWHQGSARVALGQCQGSTRVIPAECGCARVALGQCRGSTSRMRVC